MKLKILIALWLLALGANAQASITFVEEHRSSQTNSGTGTGTITTFFGTNVAVGDLIVIYMWNPGGASQTPVISDSINTGNYTVLPTSNDGVRFVSVAYKVCNAAGALSSISYSGYANSVQNAFNIDHYNGFVGTASYAGSGSSDITINFHTGTSSTAVAGTSFNTSKATELVLAYISALDGSAWGTAPTTPWTSRDSSNLGDGDLFDQHVSTSGSAVQVTGTLATADYWFVTQVGFYDNTGGGSCTHSGYSSGGAIAVPNGTTGSYVENKTTGAFDLPDCSTVPYWGIASGNYITN